MDSTGLSGDNYFAETILREEKPVVTELTQHVFNLAIVIDIDQGIVPCPLHLNYIAVREMVTAEERIRIRCLMEEGKHQASGLQPHGGGIIRGQ
jgi:hypothetical protein